MELMKLPVDGRGVDVVTAILIELETGVDVALLEY